MTSKVLPIQKRKRYADLTIIIICLLQNVSYTFLFRHGGRAPHMIHPHVPMPHMQIRPVQLHGPPGNPFRDGMLEQMNEILRMREQQRANMRLIRQREQQALRDFERAARNKFVTNTEYLNK